MNFWEFLDKNGASFIVTVIIITLLYAGCVPTYKEMTSCKESVSIISDTHHVCDTQSSMKIEGNIVTCTCKK